MKKIKKTTIYFIVLLFTYSCGTLSEAGKTLRNEKTRTTDEFLVKKRQPLSLPPDYENIPNPRSKDSKEKSEQDEISEILKIPKKKETTKGTSNVEQSIINQIRK